MLRTSKGLKGFKAGAKFGVALGVDLQIVKASQTYSQATKSRSRGSSKATTRLSLRPSGMDVRAVREDQSHGCKHGTKSEAGSRSRNESSSDAFFEAMKMTGRPDDGFMKMYTAEMLFSFEKR